VLFVGNFTPVPRHGYRLGVPATGRYREILNTDAREYGGSGMGNLGVVTVQPVPAHGFDQSIVLTLPPLAVLYLVPETAPETP
jgi:1,4-alpha-glucan branching enzyme